MLTLANRVRETLSRRRHAQELQALGAYTPGANASLDEALATGERFDTWARQPPHEPSPHDVTVRGLAAAVAQEHK